VVDVPLPRPRSTADMLSDGFLQTLRTLRAHIQDESLAAMHGELADHGLEGFGVDVGPSGVKDLV